MRRSHARILILVILAVEACGTDVEVGSNAMVAQTPDNSVAPRNSINDASDSVNDAGDAMGDVVTPDAQSSDANGQPPFVGMGHMPQGMTDAGARASADR